jgi:1,4-dihydroxy-2-naphthoyl-CoA hydrolase
MIWKMPFTLQGLNTLMNGTIGGHLDIKFVDSGDDFLEAEMPVDQRTVQPFGLLHGGASVVLSETLGSVAAMLCIPEDSGQMAVGIEVNANHLRAVRKGKVTGVVRPIRVGNKVQVWEIEIFDERKRKTCVSRLTTMTVKV